jgi:hypothetical protein
MGQQMKGKASKESKERNRRFFPVQISSTWGDLQRDVSVKMDAKTLSQILDFMIWADHPATQPDHYWVCFYWFTGTRFRPLSLNVAKPLFPLAGQPMVHHPILACKKVCGQWDSRDQKGGTLTILDFSMSPSLSSSIWNFLCPKCMHCLWPWGWGKHSLISTD